MDEGYIKFNCLWTKTEALPVEKIVEINTWRQRIHDLGLIGILENGIGFGNISVRIPETKHFVITGTATGGVKQLGPEHYAIVTGFDIEKEVVECKGPVKASSESMTHAVIYEQDQSINAIIHVHNLEMWKRLIDKVPTTAKEASFGSSEIANDVIRLFKETDVKKKKIMVMAGHKEGVISFGHDLDEAGKILFNYFKDEC